MADEQTVRFRAKEEDQKRLQWLQEELAIDATSVIKMALKLLADKVKACKK